MKPRILRIVGVCLVGMGVLLGVSAAVLAVQTSSADEGRHQSEATRRGRYTYHPVVAFEVGGEEHTFTGRAGSDPPKYTVGEQVEVLHNPDSPSDARLTAGFVYGLEVSFGLAALVLLVVGGALIAARSRAAARSRIAPTDPLDPRTLRP